jgi:hypothetical protein
MALCWLVKTTAALPALSSFFEFARARIGGVPTFAALLMPSVQVQRHDKI